MQNMVGEGDGRWGGRPAGARVQNDRGCAGEAFFDVQDGSSSPFEVTVGTLDSDCSPTPPPAHLLVSGPIAACGPCLSSTISESPATAGHKTASSPPFLNRPAKPSG